MNLSANFTLEEMVFSPTAIRLGIDNTPSQEIIENLIMLCQRVLEPLRAKVSKPIHITSGYRCVALNKAIGGAANSQHQLGQAADTHVDGMITEEWFQFIKNSGIIVDQEIQEFDAWVHISYNDNPRQMYLRAIKRFGKTVYFEDHEI